MASRELPPEGGYGLVGVARDPEAPAYVPPTRGRRRVAVIAGGVAIGVVLIVGLLLIELLVDVSSRKTAARLLAAGLVALIALRVRRAVDLLIAHQPRSTFEAVRAPAAAWRPELGRFQQLSDEIRAATRSQQYFEHVFWPRACALAESRMPGSSDALAKPVCRVLGRGPSLAALAGLVGSIEAIG